MYKIIIIGLSNFIHNFKISSKTNINGMNWSTIDLKFIKIY